VSFLTANINLAASIRELYGKGEPDPVQAAVLAEIAGADGIAVQIRTGRRVVKDQDLFLLKNSVKSQFTIEMPPAEEMVNLALEVKPDAVILVADYAGSQGTVSPIDFDVAEIDYSETVSQLHGAGVEVGFLVQPEPAPVKKAHKSGAAVVQIDCSAYASAREEKDVQDEFDRIGKAASQAGKSNMTVVAARGLDIRNLRALVEADLFHEFSVGFGLSSRAMLVGYDRAVQDFLRLINR